MTEPYLERKLMENILFHTIKNIAGKINIIFPVLNVKTVKTEVIVDDKLFSTTKSKKSKC